MNEKVTPDDRRAELDVSRCVAEAASDYKLAKVDRNFARKNGGVRALEKCLLDATKRWEDYIDSMGEES